MSLYRYKKGSGQQCFLCDETATTGDHIPPSGLFPTSIRGVCKFLEVPACAKHNHGSKLDDEYFRLVMSTASAKDPTALKLLEERVFKRNKEGRVKSQRLLTDLHNKMKPVVVKYEDGSLEEMYKFEIDKPRFQAIIDKIVRGLYWHHNGHRLPDGYFVTPYLWNTSWNETQRNLICTLPILSVGHQAVFEYRYGEVDSGDKNKVFVGMSFYGMSNVVYSTIYSAAARLGENLANDVQS